MARAEVERLAERREVVADGDFVRSVLEALALHAAVSRGGAEAALPRGRSTRRL